MEADTTEAGPSTSTPLDPPDTPSRPRGWTRRLSSSSIPRPALPSLAGLRAALLGYIGEVERAVKGRVADEDEDFGMSDFVSSPSSMSGLGEDDRSGSSSSIAGPSTLRRRNVGQSGEASGDMNGFFTDTTDDNGLLGTQLSLLNHLSSLREDITRYLPQIPVPSASALGARGEWLKNLPHKLRILDLSVAPLPPDARAPSSPVIDESGSVEHARRKLIGLVKTYLPDEDWSGWERLGWEEQESDSTSRRLSLDLGKGIPVEDAEDVEEEPSWLFPNRTPASAQAMASRRRAVRSKSLGAANFPTLSWSGVEMPRLTRTKTEPYDLSHRLAKDPSIDGESEDEDDLDAADILVHSEFVDGLNLHRIPSPRDLGPTVAEALKRADDGKRLIVFEDLPFLWRNNEHIITGYRFIPLHASTGPIPLIKSAFTWHNETVNIHSHFIPTVMITVIIPIIIYTSPLPDAHPLDTVTLVIYLTAAAACMISSAGWHVLAGCASHKWFEWGACVDYIGISWLIAASFFTVLYNAFYCQPKTVLLYSSVNLTCGILGSYLPFQKWFNERRYKNARISFFLFLCFAMFAPMLQLFYQHGWERGKNFVAPFVPSILTYVTGLVFYAFHFPECVWPGKFDYWGASHHLWHAGIVGAIILHFLAIFKAHDMKYEYSCVMPGATMGVGDVVEKGWWIVLRSMGLST